ncbi:hypothetical protein D9M71_250920 [compost metagenome]
MLTEVSSALFEAPMPVLAFSASSAAVTFSASPLLSRIAPLSAVRPTLPFCATMLPTCSEPCAAFSTTSLPLPAWMLPTVRPLFSVMYTPPVLAVASSLLLWMLKARSAWPTLSPIRVMLRPVSWVPSAALNRPPLKEPSPRKLVAETGPVMNMLPWEMIWTSLVPVAPLDRVTCPLPSLIASSAVGWPLTLTVSRAVILPRISWSSVSVT